MGGTYGNNKAFTILVKNLDKNHKLKEQKKVLQLRLGLGLGKNVALFS